MEIDTLVSSLSQKPTPKLYASVVAIIKANQHDKIFQLSGVLTKLLAAISRDMGGKDFDLCVIIEFD